ncbi:hypothetical protein V22_05290 [Calycomorphotria hydatis]|uniref:DUF1592 domain-containing protein n=2 Tax=Calycomorphotria hydatis TaxID=2528027 RepID=A0A517T4L3_9PLAN|nr:hypothetical protein V22_05290 [Calycomorphotria hydatis]
MIATCSTGLAEELRVTRAEASQWLNNYCLDCHTAGAEEAGLAVDTLLAGSADGKHLNEWVRVWQNVRAELMPPLDSDRPDQQQRTQLLHWIERDIFQLDPENPDPGRVTIRRLNREEYRNTINDLLGVNYPVHDQFPPDDTGYGFDTIGDVLSLSPLLFEKYLEAAREIVAVAVPLEGPGVAYQELDGEQFVSPENKKHTGNWVPFEQNRTLHMTVNLAQSGRYRLELDVEVAGSEEASDHSADVAFNVGDQQVISKNLGWDQRKSIILDETTELSEGEHKLQLSVREKEKPNEDEKPLRLRVHRLRLIGPLDKKVREYDWRAKRIFFAGPPVGGQEEKQKYAREILRRFGFLAFRRPIEDATLNRLVDSAMEVSSREDRVFEHGIAHAITAILMSPNFLFRAEIQPEPNNSGSIVPIDEYALASRLSYLLWNSTPDYRLLELARKGELRSNLRAEVDRLLEDKRSSRFYSQFVGQWLQTNDVRGIFIDAKRALEKDQEKKAKAFSSRVRSAMQAETELLFQHLVNERRPLTEFLTAEYSFLNESLAEYYDIKGVEGRNMRKVDLPPESNRRGILAHGSMHIVTSNPTRTSPVKRGLFLLENLLGTPAPPAPEDVPSFEQAKKAGHGLTVRGLMELHRKEPMCASCHARMDPLGLALENFTAVGTWRDTERDQPIDSAGVLITGEKFTDYRELSQILATSRRLDFYRCVTEKLLTYALGRGVEYYDAPTIDRIVNRLIDTDGDTRELIYAVVESAPFQKRRGDGALKTASLPTTKD